MWREFTRALAAAWREIMYLWDLLKKEEGGGRREGGGREEGGRSGEEWGGVGRSGKEEWGGGVRSE